MKQICHQVAQEDAVDWKITFSLKIDSLKIPFSLNGFAFFYNMSMIMETIILYKVLSVLKSNDA